jgi:PEP-CTERM motif-containing protein
MSFTTGKCAVLSACLGVAVPAANATMITLAGEGLTIRYEDKAVQLIGRPSFLATSLMSSARSFAGVQGAGVEAASGLKGAADGVGDNAVTIAALAQERLPRSFAEGVALSFSIGQGGGPEPGLYSLLLAGLGLFGLIVRQRIAALSRFSHSPGFL